MPNLTILNKKFQKLSIITKDFSKLKLKFSKNFNLYNYRSSRWCLKFLSNALLTRGIFFSGQNPPLPQTAEFFLIFKLILQIGQAKTELKLFQVFDKFSLYSWNTFQSRKNSFILLKSKISVQIYEFKKNAFTLLQQINLQNEFEKVQIVNVSLRFLLDKLQFEKIGVSTL